MERKGATTAVEGEKKTAKQLEKNDGAVGTAERAATATATLDRPREMKARQAQLATARVVSLKSGDRRVLLTNERTTVRDLLGAMGENPSLANTTGVGGYQVRRRGELEPVDLNSPVSPNDELLLVHDMVGGLQLSLRRL